jgi:hypothetical protein
VSSNQKSINEDVTMDNMEAERTQNKDTPKPEDTTVSSKRPKKMRFDRLPDTPPERTRGTSRPAAYKNGNDYVTTTQTPLITSHDINVHADDKKN